MAKYDHHIALLVVLTTSLVAGVSADGLSPGRTCMESAAKLVEDGHAVGAWSRIDQNGPNNDVSYMVAAAVERLNADTDDDKKYAAPNHNIIAAYKQLVNGINYCVRFTVEAVGCKNGASDCIDSESDETLVCDSYAYRAFNWAKPQLGRLDGVVCG